MSTLSLATRQWLRGRRPSYGYGHASLSCRPGCILPSACGGFYYRQRGVGAWPAVQKVDDPIAWLSTGQRGHNSSDGYFPREDPPHIVTGNPFHLVNCPQVHACWDEFFETSVEFLMTHLVPPIWRNVMGRFGMIPTQAEGPVPPPPAGPPPGWTPSAQAKAPSAASASPSGQWRFSCRGPGQWHFSSRGPDQWRFSCRGSDSEGRGGARRSA